MSTMGFITVQLFDSLHTETTASVMGILESTLQSGYGLSSTRPSRPGDISRDTPVLVLCQNYSRIATDIKRATEGLAGTMLHITHLSQDLYFEWPTYSYQQVYYSHEGEFQEENSQF